ncbi:ABC transporter B family member 28 [Vitis vinifera]|uniref:ABC transporter B family member 28 n=1 Tax=Vitis vinifera TaxID=29760 RepID=A0A438GWS5_VITVI|nr:ABC transporter B family member 28 [Vitis vinifera]
MASATLPLPLRSHLTRLKPPISHAPRALACHVKLSHSHSNPFPPFSLLRNRSKGVVRPPSAYVSGPASDPIITEPDPKVESSNDAHDETVEPPSAISSSLLWSLLMRYKLRLAVSAVTLIGCSACTLSMPLFSEFRGIQECANQLDPTSKFKMDTTAEPVPSVVFLNSLVQDLQS